MPDPARVAQAQALEIPVKIQGAKTVEGTDRRELFTEDATTTLVFDNGAVLNMRSRVVVGQPIFLHNLQNGREILCKVLESPADGQSGATDLEFATPDPDFWRASDAIQAAPTETAAAAEPNAEVHQEAPHAFPETAASETTEGAPPSPSVAESPEAAESTLAMMSTPQSIASAPPVIAPVREELVAAHEMIPQPEGIQAAVAVEEPPTQTEPTGEQIDAALRKMAGAPPLPLQKATDALLQAHGVHAEPDHSRDQENLAALMARDAKLAKWAASKTKPGAEGTAEEAVNAEAGAEPQLIVRRIPLSERLTTGRNAIIVEVVAGVLILVALGFIWRTVAPLYIHQDETTSAPQPKKKAPAVAGKPSTPPAVKSNAPASGPAPAPTAGSAPNAAAAKNAPRVSEPKSQPVVIETPSAPVAPAAKEEAPAVKIVVREGSSSEPRIEASQNEPPADSSSEEETEKHPGRAARANGSVPAKILSQSQPAFPSWAKGLDVSGTVTLDAVIDEKGNVTDTKVISGPRALQHAAEQAVGLWIFEPAQQDGKPTPSHMTLTVEFQR